MLISLCHFRIDKVILNATFSIQLNIYGIAYRKVSESERTAGGEVLKRKIKQSINSKKWMMKLFLI